MPLIYKLSVKFSDYDNEYVRLLCKHKEHGKALLYVLEAAAKKEKEKKKPSTKGHR